MPVGQIEGQFETQDVAGKQLLTYPLNFISAVWGNKAGIKLL